MSAKILLADDSPTIQKVIKITLANEPYDILECKTEKDLYNILKKTPVDLVLLDYNLSEECSGHDLVRRLREIAPNPKVLMMFGTFDTIDEKALKASGITAWVTKPFDSSKFINMCHGLLDSSAGGLMGHGMMGYQEAREKADSLAGKEDDPDLTIKLDNKEDEWVLDSPVKSVQENRPKELSKDLLNINYQQSEKVPRPAVASGRNDILKNEIRDWGMSVPPRLDMNAKGGSEFTEIPPILSMGQREFAMDNEIGHETDHGTDQELEHDLTNTDNLQFSTGPAEKSAGDGLSLEEWKYPDQDDLGYPGDSRSTSSPNKGLDHEALLKGVDLDHQVAEGLEMESPMDLQSEMENKVVPKFISLEDLSPDIEGTGDLNTTDKTEPDMKFSFQVDGDGARDRDKENLKRNLEEQIEEEVSPDKFWSVDDSAKKSRKPTFISTDELNLPESSDLGQKNGLLQDEIKTKDIEINIPLETKAGKKEKEEVNTPFSMDDSGLHFDDPINVAGIKFGAQEKKNGHGPEMDHLVAEMVAKFSEGILKELRPMIQECLKNYCKQTIEKVAWEILPDLAENVVKAELKNLADSVKNETRNKN